MLYGVPSGSPDRVQTLPILQSAYPEIHKTYDDLTAKNKEWFKKLFETGSIPDYEEAAAPVDYFLFPKFKISVPSSSISSSTEEESQIQISMKSY